MSNLRPKALSNGRGALSRVLLSMLTLVTVSLFVAACGGADPTATLQPTATSAAAAPVTAPPAEMSSMDKFKVEWDDLIAKAKAEGELVIVTGGAASRAYRSVGKAFGDKFGIEVTVATGRDGEHVDRILAERQAGKYLVDVTHLGPTTSRSRAIPNGLMDEIPNFLIHPEVTDTSLWFGGQHFFADAERKYLFTHSASVSEAIDFRYNTNRVSQADIDQVSSVFDLLDPKWKGKIVSLPADNAGAGGTWYSVYVHPDVGPEWVRQFITTMEVNWVPDARAVADGLAQGKYHLAVAVGAAGRDIDGLAAEGLPVAEYSGGFKERKQLSGSGSSNQTSIFTKPAHPNAAKLYVNWFLSKEGQTTVHEMSDVPPDPTLRIDGVPVGKTLEAERRKPGEEYLFISADPFYLQREREAVDFARDVYRSIAR